MDMCFYWIQDRVDQNQIIIFWRPGIENLSDYFTKHHPSTHHKQMRPIFISSSDSTSDFQGCINYLTIAIIIILEQLIILCV